jgi:hypothetical protein
MTIKNSRDYLRRVSPYRFVICDDCDLERQQHPSPVCDAFKHDYGDELLAGMGALHATREPIGEQRHLRSVE